MFFSSISTIYIKIFFFYLRAYKSIDTDDQERKNQEQVLINYLQFFKFKFLFYLFCSLFI